MKQLFSISFDLLIHSQTLEVFTAARTSIPTILSTRLREIEDCELSLVHLLRMKVNTNWVRPKIKSLLFTTILVLPSTWCQRVVQSAVTDSQIVSFSTSATQYNSAPQQSTIAPSGSSAQTPPSKSTTTVCATQCVKNLDVICFLRHKCWSSLGRLVALYVCTALLGKLPMSAVC